MLVADVRSAAGHPSEAQTAVDTRMAIDTSSAAHAVHSLPEATVPEAADGQSAARYNFLYILKAGPAGGRLRRPSLAGTATTGRP